MVDFFILTTSPDEPKKADRKRNEQRLPIKKIKKLESFFIPMINIQTVKFKIFVPAVFFPWCKSRSKRWLLIAAENVFLLWLFVDCSVFIFFTNVFDGRTCCLEVSCEAKDDLSGRMRRPYVIICRLLDRFSTVSRFRIYYHLFKENIYICIYTYLYNTLCLHLTTVRTT